MGRESLDSAESRERATSNETLAAEWRAGDLGAFRALVRRCAGLVQEPLGWLIPDGPAAEQAAVRVFMRVFEAGRRFAPDVPVATWLIRQALAEGVSWRRKNPGVSTHEPANVAVAFVGEAPEPDRLAKQLSSLKSDVYMPVMLRYLCGFSLSMVADVLAKPVDYVIGRLHIGLCEVWNVPSTRGGDAECRPLALMEWIERVLSDGSARQVDEHLEKCGRCAAHLERLADAVNALTTYGDQARADSLPDLWQVFRLRSEKTRERTLPPARLANRLTVTAAVVGTVMVALVLSLVPQFRARMQQLGGPSAMESSGSVAASAEMAGPRLSGVPARTSPRALTEDDIALTPPALSPPVPGVGPSTPEPDAASAASGVPATSTRTEGTGTAEPSGDGAGRALPEPTGRPIQVPPVQPAPRPRGSPRPSTPSVPTMEPAPPAGPARPARDMTTRMIERAMDLAPESGR